ncbi:hypothetical protein GCM10020001_016960 [Nonomuraea salmonea]
MQSLNPDGKSYGTALWAIPVDGEPYRLTRSAKGESAAVFTAAGDVLFTSARPDPTVKDATDEVPALWLLPRAGGEARQVASRAGGIGAVRTAGDVVVFSADVLDGEESADADKRKARKDAGISAILHEQFPVRYWDHDLGPGRPRLFAARLGADRLEDVRDLTPDAGDALRQGTFELTPDGASVITTWQVYLPKGESRTDLVVIDVATGERRVLLSEDGHDFGGSLAVSPDGTRLACARDRRTGYDVSARSTLWIADLATGQGREYAPDAFPTDVQWAPRLLGRLPGRRPPGPPPGLPRPARRRGHQAHRGRRRVPARQPVTRRPLRLRPAQRRRTRPPGRPGSTPSPARSPTCRRPHRAPRCPARSPRSPPPPTTAPPSAAGSPCPRPPPPPTRPRSCCSCTAARSAPGTTGSGAGSRGSSLSRAMRCSCPTRACPPATARR